MKYFTILTPKNMYKPEAELEESKEEIEEKKDD